VISHQLSVDGFSVITVTVETWAFRVGGLVHGFFDLIVERVRVAVKGGDGKRGESKKG